MIQKSKVLILLSRFNSDELKRFKLFLESPYFNNNRKLLTLFDFLQSNNPGFLRDDIPVRAALEAISADMVERSDARDALIKLTSKLLILAEQFLEHEGLKREKFSGLQIRLKYLRKLGMGKWEQSILTEMQGEVKNYPYWDEHWLGQRYTLEKEKASWMANLEAYQQKLNLSAYNKALDDFYVRAKLECICHQKNHSNVTNHQYDFIQSDQLDKIVQSQGETTLPITRLWLAAKELLFNPTDKQHFFNLKPLLFSVESQLPPAEIRTLYGFLFNTARHAFSNHDDYFQELLILYKRCLYNNALLVDGQISPLLFKNIVTVGLNQGEIPWVLSFLEKFRDLIYRNYTEREDIVRLCEAFISFEQKSFDQSLQLLNETRFKDMQNKLSEKRLRLKVYFELQYTDSLEDAANSFRKFLTIHKNEIPAHHLDANRIFITLTLSLLHLNPYDKEGQKQLIHEIEAHTHIYEKHWFAQKINAIKSRFP